AQQTQFKTPEETVRWFYRMNYQVHGEPMVDVDDDKIDGLAFDKALLKMYRKAQKDQNIDEDFFVQGQDYYIPKPIEVSEASIVGKKAKVSATVTLDDNDGNPPPKIRVEKFVFMLVKENGNWKIDDVTYVNQHKTFRGWLRVR